MRFDFDQSWRSENKYFCPYCDYAMDAATSARGEYIEPKDGDLSMCIRCGRGSFFVISPTMGVMNLRQMTDEEVANMPDEALVTGMAIQDYWASRGGFPENRKDIHEDS